jgi:DNA-binding CsgD family transcriptional regulator
LLLVFAVQCAQAMELIEQRARLEQQPALGAPPPVPLSGREHQVLALLAEGFTTREIADELGLASVTVKTHVDHLCEKFEVSGSARSRLLAVRDAMLLGRVPGTAGGHRRVLQMEDAERAEPGMIDAYRAAAGGPVDVIIDYVWGAPLEAAIAGAGVGARIVQVGRAGAHADVHLSADLIRAKSLNVLGYATYHVSHAVRAAAYQQLVRHAAEDRLRVDVECIPLSKVEQAWTRQRSGVRSRLVLLP